MSVCLPRGSALVQIRSPRWPWPGRWSLSAGQAQEKPCAAISSALLADLQSPRTRAPSRDVALFSRATSRGLQGAPRAQRGFPEPGAGGPLPSAQRSSAGTVRFLLGIEGLSSPRHRTGTSRQAGCGRHLPPPPSPEIATLGPGRAASGRRPPPTAELQPQQDPARSAHPAAAAAEALPSQMADFAPPPWVTGRG